MASVSALRLPVECGGRVRLLRSDAVGPRARPKWWKRWASHLLRTPSFGSVPDDFVFVAVVIVHMSSPMLVVSIVVYCLPPLWCCRRLLKMAGYAALTYGLFWFGCCANANCTETESWCSNGRVRAPLQQHCLVVLTAGVSELNLRTVVSAKSISLKIWGSLSTQVSWVFWSL